MTSSSSDLTLTKASSKEVETLVEQRRFDRVFREGDWVAIFRFPKNDTLNVRLVTNFPEEIEGSVGLVN